MHIYRLKENEDLYDVAREFGISPQKLAEANGISLHSRLPKGRELAVIIPTRTYNVKTNDDLSSIARRFNTECDAILRMNPELCGNKKLYSGQLLNVRSGGERYGMISTNGYLYRGTSKDKLNAVLPYLGYLTVCSAIYKNGAVHTMFNTDDIVRYVKNSRRIPFVRVYMTSIPNADDIKSFTDSLIILGKSGGFGGVTLSSLGSMGSSTERDRFVLAVRKELMENDLLLLAEGDIEADCSYMEYADMGILTYDKLHKADIPSFEDGEMHALNSYAESRESSRTFIEIPSFAYSGGKYIEKAEAIRITDRKHGEIEYDDERKLCRAIYGKNKRCEILYESLENTKAKLELISELGYMGVSFDIGRVCIPDLMIISWMFGIIDHPTHLSECVPDLNCRGEKQENQDM